MLCGQQNFPRLSISVVVKIKYYSPDKRNLLKLDLTLYVLIFCFIVFKIQFGPDKIKKMGLLVFLCVIRVPLQKRVCSECFLNEGTDDDFPLCVLQEAFDAKSDEERKEFGVSIVQRFLRSQV